MSVYFDASVIIAALLSKTGGSTLLIEYIKQGRIIGITSQTAIDEILEEEVRQRIKKSKEEIEHFVAQSGLVVRERITVSEIAQYKPLIAAEDAHLVAGATLTKCTYLVSLDKKHLLREDIKKKFLPLRIVSPGELLEELISK